MNYLRTWLINWLLPSSATVGPALLTAAQLEALIKSLAEKIAATANGSDEEVVVRCAYMARVARDIAELADRRRFLRLSHQRRIYADANAEDAIPGPGALG